MHTPSISLILFTYIINIFIPAIIYAQKPVDSISYYSNLNVSDSIKIERIWRYSSAKSIQTNSLEERGFLKALEIARSIHNHRLESRVNENYGYCCQMRGLTDKAYGLYMENVDIALKNKDSMLWIKANYKLGYLFSTAGKDQEAIPYFELIEKYIKKENSKVNILLAIGTCYSNLNENKKGIEYLQKALSIINSSNKVTYQNSYIHSNLANIYMKVTNLAKAEYHFDQGILAAKTIKDVNTLSMLVIDKSRLLNKKGRHQEAINMLLEIKDAVYKDYDGFRKTSLEYELYRSYNALHDESNALKALTKAYNLKEDLYKTENSKSLNDLELKYQTKNKQLEIANQKLELSQKESENNYIIEQKKKQTYIFLGITFILIANGIFIFNRYRRSKRDSKVILQQNNLIKEKQKEILDSISYAKRLQDAIIPPDSYWHDKLKQSFVLYKPKDIVAGDFYWMELNDKVLHFAAADCTGHGVPGAMVSVICSNALNRAIKEFKLTDPGKILDKVRELVIETFEKSTAEVYDGMDISFCTLNLETSQLSWAGANNPIWIKRFGSPTFEEIKPNKQPIGKFAVLSPFTAHHIQLNANDTIYIFTDGYADQFGGPKGKKYKYKQLQELLLSNCHESMAIQKLKLETEFNIWKRDLEQVDDVCVIGVKL